MTNWTETLRLKGMAEEDVYFARRDRELIDDMHRRREAGKRLLKALRKEKATES
jgi:hypothetical protein